MVSASQWRREIKEVADQRGWFVSPTEKGHIKLTHPKIPTPVFAAGTPSDTRALPNTLGHMRRLEKQFGIEVADEREQRSRKGGRPPIQEFDVRVDGIYRYYVVTCVECEATAEVRSRVDALIRPTASIATEFRKRGWNIKRLRSSDTCPQCSGAVGLVKPALIDAPKVPEPKPAPLLAKSPLALMGDNEKRQIAALDEAHRRRQRKIIRTIERVWVDAIGYIGSESDATVARRAQVSEKEVAAVRAEFFGSEAFNSKSALFKRELTALKRDLESFQNETIERLSKLELRINAVLRQASVMSEGEIEDALADTGSGDRSCGAGGV